MARDLIPPPSPAGRPTSPDGTPNLIELPPEPTPLNPEPASSSPPPGPSQFRNRFGFLLGALAGVFIAVALVAAIIIADQNRSSDARDAGLAANWSRWQPSDTTIDGGAQEIADHVGAEYKHPDGKQLVQIKGGALPDQLKLKIHSSTITDIEGTRVLYQLDGLGDNGSIEGGKPSTTRLKVIHREALELALYTFRYLPDAESVTMMLPPPPPTDDEKQAAALANATGQAAPSTPISVLFYRPGDLKPQLQVPLGQTLGPKAPNTDTYSGPEADTVETLTLSNRFNLEQQAGTSTLVLNRPSTP
jgi:hypothetical protein